MFPNKSTKKMNSIKKIGVALFTTVALSASAQHDVKFNFSNALLYEINLSYEYLLSDYATIGAFGGYAYDFPDVANPNTYAYFGPEFRYYVSPKNGADRFFIGAYASYKAGNATLQLEESGRDINQEPIWFWEESRAHYTKAVFGLTVGSKWVVKDAFVVGVFGGFGRNLHFQYNDDDFVSHENMFVPDSYKTSVDMLGNSSRYWDFRVGVNIGWRLGK